MEEHRVRVKEFTKGIIKTNELLGYKMKSVRRSVVKDLFVVILFSLLGTMISIFLDAYEWFYEFGRSMERYDFDEIALFLPFLLAITLTWFSYRRLQEAKSEMIERKQAEKELKKYQEKLELMVEKRTAALMDANEQLMREKDAKV